MAALPNPHLSPDTAGASKTRRSVLILYTGGTMGMITDGKTNALRPEPNHLSAQLLELAELRKPEMPTYNLIEYDPLLDSASMTPDDWIKIIRDIESHYYDYDGFVIIHGTDTMAYTASALSFALQNLAKPVILTGAQLPFSSVYSDARRNLIVSVYCASNLDIPEVCIFFNRQLLRGNRAVKVNSWALNAFESPNFPALATLGTNLSVASDALRPQPKGRFRVHTEFNRNIVVMRLIPGFSDSVVEAIFRDGKIQGLILQTYGTGNASSRRSEFLQVIADGVARGVVVVITSQCLSGTVDLSQYETGRRLQEVGCVSAGDMTTEAAATKLGYLLTLGLRREELCRLMVTDLCGEISDRRQGPAFGRIRAAL